MAQTNYDRITRGMDLLKIGLTPFVQRELHTAYGDDWRTKAQVLLSDTRLRSADGVLDAAALLVIMDREWKDIFRQTLGKGERSIVNELLEVRNAWAHQRTFSTDDTDRALDSIQRLLTSVSATNEANEVGKMKLELRRLAFSEQARSEIRKIANSAVEGQPAAGLTPWREIIEPHPDVASGRFKQAEFMADLWQVYSREGSDEYRDPVQFFRRTYLTTGLNMLLTNALRRLSGRGGDPVIKLQTNFGGGKTHSMLALFHLFSGRKAMELPGLEDVFRKSEISESPKVRRAVLVGNKISPGAPSKRADGITVRTLWGELAWQLGGKEGYAMVQEDDERATNPGDALRLLFNRYSPCLILIDEWVAYARQLHDSKDLPAGDFETHFTFAQALTEAVRASENALLVVSIPASDDPNSQNESVSDLEVGGMRGRESLKKLENIIGRSEIPWRSASAKESFAIVRRRLFAEPSDPTRFRARDAVVRAFAEFYRKNKNEFPSETAQAGYEDDLREAYPVHPEIFKRLNDDWATLVTFQRTRGVLRLMAAVIHSLWERQDKSLLILPGNLPIDDPTVQPELTRYLPPTWTPVIDKDIDGPDSLPLQIDRDKPNLGRYSATRRVARTIYLGSAPTLEAANKGIEDSRIKLGCTQPGEAPAIFGDALRHLSENATYLYVNERRYWFSTQPSVNRLAEERSSQRTQDEVFEEIKKRLREEQGTKADFARVHAAPSSSADISDDPSTRLVVFGPERVHATKEDESPARKACAEFLQWRGTSPRHYANTLVFLAPDRSRLTDLEKAVRMYLAWKSIDEEHQILNLDSFQANQANTKHKQWADTVRSRVPECYFWLLVPNQKSAADPMEWQEIRLQGSEGLSARASKKLKNDGLLIVQWAATLLRLELDKIPLWRGNDVPIKQLVDDFATYVYLPRLRHSSVLIETIQEGLNMLMWTQDSFAYAESYDEAAGRYRGLRCGQHVSISEQGSFGLLIKPDVALMQLEADKIAVQPGSATSSSDPSGLSPGPSQTASSATALASGQEAPKRFHATVTLDPVRVGRDAGRIANEVVAHLSGLMGADVKVTLDIEANIPAGAPDNVVRTVTENCRTLKFDNHGFEKE
jgi:predicted AAA+ superfamily ATPase